MSDWALYLQCLYSKDTQKRLAALTAAKWGSTNLIKVVEVSFSKMCIFFSNFKVNGTGYKCREQWTDFMGGIIVENHKFPYEVKELKLYEYISILS